MKILMNLLIASMVCAAGNLVASYPKGRVIASFEEVVNSLDSLHNALAKPAKSVQGQDEYGRKKAKFKSEVNILRMKKDMIIDQANIQELGDILSELVELAYRS